MMEIGYDPAEFETVNLHTASSLIDFRWHAVRFEVPLPIWRNQQRIAALSIMKQIRDEASHISERINEKMYPIGSK